MSFLFHYYCNNKKDKLKPRANVFLTGNLKSFTLQFNEKIVKQVQIENPYIYGGKFEIKDKILPVIRRCDCSAYLDPLNVLLSQPLLSPSESPQTT